MSDVKELKAEEFLDPATSSYVSCVLPTGFVYKDEIIKDCLLKEMTGEEEDILSASKVPISLKFQKIMERCVIQMGSLRQDLPDWSQIIKGLTLTDRLFLLIQIRMASLGSDMSFVIECPFCKVKSNHTLDLNDIKFGSGNPEVSKWEGVLPRSKLRYVYSVATGFNEDKISKVTGDDVLSHLILSRLEILGDKQPTLSAIKKLSMMDRQYLRAQIQKSEPKVDDKVEVICPSCNKEFETELDINSPNFFFPSDL